MELGRSLPPTQGVCNVDYGRGSASGSGRSSPESRESGRGADDVGVGDHVEQGDGVGGQRGPQGGREIVGGTHGVALGAQAPSVRGEVYVPYLDAGGTSQGACLVHSDGAVHPVSEDDDGDL